MAGEPSRREEASEKTLCQAEAKVSKREANPNALQSKTICCGECSEANIMCSSSVKVNSVLLLCLLSCCCRYLMCGYSYDLFT
jgi:hypothetical protein